ncbi:hypothetical protein C2E25_04660 [Geothermobacter hydrogeniphilus]|uniref:Uncharacterized protein n=1 Tax=Geothermobacter hydrogeniphilus TaxID=1969733 RepID=A0A2K2HC87_9BACT|nr:hypothetical protein [Geothermobacter hydrogeniphilus]PNU20887.1 hypothetical protein C2E25_04660 [Geothermobacter hydrogeniphilus]
MVLLNSVTETGQVLYLDIWKREKSRAAAGGELVSGILGDGSYEGEVLVEITAGRCELTFLDQHLDPLALKDFFARVDREQLLEDLQEALLPTSDGARNNGLPLFRRDAPLAGASGDAFPEPLVREGLAAWQPNPEIADGFGLG